MVSGVPSDHLRFGLRVTLTSNVVPLITTPPFSRRRHGRRQVGDVLAVRGDRDEAAHGGLHSLDRVEGRRIP